MCREALRIACGAFRSIPIDSLHALTGAPTIEERREYYPWDTTIRSDLIFLILNITLWQIPKKNYYSQTVESLSLSPWQSRTLIQKYNLKNSSIMPQFSYTRYNLYRNHVKFLILLSLFFVLEYFVDCTCMCLYASWWWITTNQVIQHRLGCEHLQLQVNMWQLVMGHYSSDAALAGSWAVATATNLCYKSIIISVTVDACVDAPLCDGLLSKGCTTLRYKTFPVRCKKNEAGNSLNAIKREPVPTRFLNPNASEASYKPKQRSYRTFCTEMVLYRNVAKRYPSDPELAESCTPATAGV